MKRTSTKSFQIELGTKYDTNDAKGKFGRRVQICDVGSISAGGFGPPVQIRCETDKTLAQIK